MGPGPAAQAADSQRTLLRLASDVATALAAVAPHAPGTVSAAEAALAAVSMLRRIVEQPDQQVAIYTLHHPRLDKRILASC